jgi:phospholipase/carboxylesterase
MQTQALTAIEINPDTKPKTSVIWLHGLGADGYDFVDIVPQLNLPKELAVRFVFPHAPVIPVTINGGYQMRAWFDIYGLNPAAAQDETGIKNAQHLIDQLINKELDSGIAADHIVIAGFSQGGAMALQCGLHFPHKLAGILVLSSFLMLADKLEHINKSIPILMAHGQYDDVVPIKWGEYSRDKLNNLGCKVAWSSYPMAHQLCDQEIVDIAHWLQDRFKA